MNPRSKDWQMIIISRRHDITIISITHSFHSICFLSDHALFQSKVSFCLARRNLWMPTIPKCINIVRLKTVGKQKELWNNLKHSLDSVDIEGLWKSLITWSTQASYSHDNKRIGFDDNNEEVKKLIKCMMHIKCG